MQAMDVEGVMQRASCLYSAAEVDAAIAAQAQQLNGLLADANWQVLCVLNGGIPYCGILLPQLRVPVTLDTVHATRYRGETRGSELKWYSKPVKAPTGQNVLLVDDILDEGITLAALVDWCHQQGAAQVKTAVMVDKAIGRSRPIEADSVALSVPNDYVFGYGMDYCGQLRNAPGIFAAAQEDC